MIPRGLRELRQLCSALLVTGIVLLSPVAAADHLDIHVVEDASDKITINYQVRDFTKKSVTIDGKSYLSIGLDRESRMKHRIGAPELPTVNRSVAIPANAEMELRVVSSTFEEISDVDIMPSKGILLRSIDPDQVAYEFGAEYKTNAFYPGALATLGKPYILRDRRGAVVKLAPFQYNPVTRTLRVYRRIEVELRKVGPGKANVLTNSRRRPSRVFDSIYDHHFLNDTTPKATALPFIEEGEMLIIAHDEWLPNVQALVEHKNSVGITTSAVGVATIGNDATSIKNYIQSIYDNGGLAYVLLVGDVSQVATIMTTGWSGGASDPSYSKLAGDDDYPDILIGRFSAESAADVDTQVARTIDYEANSATTQDWFKKGVGIGSSEGPGDDGEYDYQHIDNIRTDLLDYAYTVVDQNYEPSDSKAELTVSLNDGRGIINYCGHGDIGEWATTGFKNADVNTLVNDNMLPFVVSVACNVGEFNSGTCFAESWLRATNGAAATGAIGFYGSSISQAWDPPMCAQDAITDILMLEERFALGALLFAGAIQMMDEYGSDGVTEFNAWHLFGDPSVRIFGLAKPPSGMRVTPSANLAAIGNAGGPFTPTALTYTLENRNDVALDFTVGANLPWLAIEPASGTIAPSSSTTVTVSLSAAAAALGNGFYADSISFTNTTDGDGDTSRSATLDVGIPEVQYDWPLDEDPGWTVEGQWAFGSPGGAGGEHGSRDPDAGHTGNNVFGYNLAGDYVNQLTEQHLTSKAIDCSALTKVSVKFWRWLGVETSEYDHAYVRVSTDGASWTTVWENQGEIADSGWVEQEIDISELADGQPIIYLRWTMGTTDDGWTYCGWNIDDVSIVGLGTPGCADADGDGFADAECGGEDCRDDDYEIRPNAVEVCDDEVDNNCDGLTDADDVACGGDDPDDPDDPDNPGDGDGGGCAVGTTQSQPLPAALLCLLFGCLFLHRRRR